MFTMDTESGFTDAVFITSSYGLGEAVVQERSTRMSSTLQASVAGGAPAILKRGIGGKATKMIYTRTVRSERRRSSWMSQWRIGRCSA